MNMLRTRTYTVKFVDKHHLQEQWYFQGYSVGDAFNAYREFKPDGAELLSITEEGEW